jgi:glutathione peroxidase
MTTEFKLKPFGIPAMIQLHTLFIRQCLKTFPLVLGLTMASAVTSAAANECPALLNHKFNRLQDDSSQNLCQYSGKVVLVVNTASYCGFTSQYEGLEKLYANYKDKGLVILGFPSNDFSQEPGNNKEIADFCYNTYGVKFPMFAKTSVKGKEANALFAALIKAGAKAPSWNFNKYLIDREGKLVANYGSTTRPDEKTFVSALEKALAAQ